MNNQAVSYIIDFVVGNEGCSSFIGYADDPYLDNKPVCIKNSSLFDHSVFGKACSMPSLPLKELEGVPILYGDPKIEYKDGKCIIYADLIASTFFLISRYEETITEGNRDKHGRFIGKGSLPYRAGFIDRPIIDEYGRILRNCLRKVGVKVDEPGPGFSTIYLTHDVDVPWEIFSPLRALKRSLGEIKRFNPRFYYPFLNLFGYPDYDPRYTFDLLIKTGRLISDAQSIYFVKSGGNHKPEDAEIYINTKSARRLLRKLSESGAILGYHISYEAGHDTSLLQKELSDLQNVVQGKITRSRNHYLASINPDDFHKLIDAGITDDYTMAYADVAGFRLGTSRPVRWIDPKTGELTKLTLHPLTIMDCTLTAKQYMNLNPKDSQSYGDRLIKRCYDNNGEVTLLLHNNIFSNGMAAIDKQNYEHFIKTIQIHL